MTATSDELRVVSQKWLDEMGSMIRQVKATIAAVADSADDPDAEFLLDCYDQLSDFLNQNSHLMTPTKPFETIPDDISF